jgi:hypothetical protein
MNSVLLFSLINPDNPFPIAVPTSPALRGHLLLLGAGLLLVSAAIIGLVIRRRLKRRRSRRHKHFRRWRSSHRTASGVAEFKRLIRDKRHRRRRERRPLNPTLAETGGLPPLRGSSTVEPTRPRPQPE